MRTAGEGVRPLIVHAPDPDIGLVAGGRKAVAVSLGGAEAGQFTQ